MFLDCCLDYFSPLREMQALMAPLAQWETLVSQERKESLEILDQMDQLYVATARVHNLCMCTSKDWVCYNLLEVRFLLCCCRGFQVRREKRESLVLMDTL